jgi:hypothetical protein
VYESVPNSVVTIKKDWNSIKDTVPVTLLNYTEIDPHLKMQIVKQKGMLCVQFQDSEYV